MRFFSEKNLLKSAGSVKAFSLIEAVAAVIILGTVLVGILAVINNSVSASANTLLKMQAYEIARENLENLISEGSATEGVEYGTSEKYPTIQWQNAVETFYEPITNRLWAKAVCTAEYYDSDGETKKVEFTHWLTGLTKKQIVELLKEREKESEFLELSDQVIESIEDAALYAGVDEQTLEQWIENGMPVTEDGSFVKGYLDLYRGSDGTPTIEQRQQADREVEQKLNPPEEKPPMPDIDYESLPFKERIEFLLKYAPDKITFEEVMKYMMQE